MSLKRQVGFGLFWVALGTLGAKGLSLLRKLILARFLVPGDFGLVAYASLAIGALELFMELGFSAALIYRKEDVEEAADTIFVAQLATSVVIYLIAWSIAPLVGTFFRTDALVPVLRVLALNLIIASIGRVPQTLLVKQMGFKKKVLPELYGSVVGCALSIGMVFMGYGVWAIVWGQLVISIITSGLVWFYCPWRPSLRFSRSVATELWDYGKHIFGSQVMVFFITNIDDAFVGRLLGDASLGYYSLAYDLSNMPATHISRIVGQVMFPAFSKVQSDLERLRDAFFRSMKYVALVATPVAIITLVFARNFIVVAYGNKWYAAAVPLQWLTIYGLTRSIAVNMGNVFKAGGKPKWLLGIAIWRLLMMAGLLYPAIKWRGVLGVAQLSAAVAVVDFVISMVLTNRIIQASWRRYVQILVPMLLVGTGTALAAHQLYLLVEHTIHPFVSMPAAGALAMLTYAAIMWLIDGELRQLVADTWAGVGRSMRRYCQARGWSGVLGMFGRVGW
jgi:PST family polysaccharide transporter